MKANRPLGSSSEQFTETPLIKTSRLDSFDRNTLMHIFLFQQRLCNEALRLCSCRRSEKWSAGTECFMEIKSNWVQLLKFSAFVRLTFLETNAEVWVHLFGSDIYFSHNFKPKLIECDEMTTETQTSYLSGPNSTTRVQHTQPKQCSSSNVHLWPQKWEIVSFLSNVWVSSLSCERNEAGSISWTSSGSLSAI